MYCICDLLGFLQRRHIITVSTTQKKTTPTATNVYTWTLGASVGFTVEMKTQITD